MKIYYLLFILSFLIFNSCKKENETVVNEIIEKMYFPNHDSIWEKKSIENIGWNKSAYENLKQYLTSTNTKSFMILVNGRIIVEDYFDGHLPTTTWQWNSAGKTLVSTITGIAQQENLLNIENKVSDYLGTNWTNTPLEKENLIKVKHLLTMTSGLNDSSELVLKSKLTFMADAGTRWSYHNVFQKLMDVVEDASNQDFETYFNLKLKNKIGMDGYWNNGLIFKIYHSNTRSMARFGLLALNNGKWKEEQIINETFFKQSISTSQNINASYGYFWWLNGKSNFMLPGSQNKTIGSLVPNAPSDMYSAMGAEDNRIYVIPSKNMVIVRMGEISDPSKPSFALSGYDNELWSKINAVIN